MKGKGRISLLEDPNCVGWYYVTYQPTPEDNMGCMLYWFSGDWSALQGTVFNDINSAHREMTALQRRQHSSVALPPRKPPFARQLGLDCAGAIARLADFKYDEWQNDDGPAGVRHGLRGILALLSTDQLLGLAESMEDADESATTDPSQT